jgi:hypothetical protein
MMSLSVVLLAAVLVARGGLGSQLQRSVSLWVENFTSFDQDPALGAGVRQHAADLDSLIIAGEGSHSHGGARESFRRAA